jgi:transcriptional regulator with XRE-family HTH domain
MNLIATATVATLCANMSETTLLGQRLRQARLDAGMTQAQVAEILGKPQTYVSKCELAQRRVFIDEFMDFASVYDKPFEFYLDPLVERMKEIDERE